MTFHSKHVRLAAIFFFSILLVTTSWADPRLWGINAIPVRQGHHIEWFRANYRASDGSVMVAWSDTRLGDRDLYGQVVNTAGEQIWGSTGQALIQVPQFRQEDPDIAALPDGYWIVAWNEFRNDSLGDVWAQKFDPQGRPVWRPGGDSTGIIIDELPESMVNEITVRCVHDGAGGAIIAWEDPRRGDPSDIFAQHIDANGNVTWTEPLRVTDTQGEQIGITSESDGQGNMIVAWNDRRDPSNQNIYCAKVTPQGTLPWGGQNGMCVCCAPGLQQEVKIAADGSGGALLTWTDQRGGAGRDVYGQRINSAGEPQWTADGLLIAGAEEDQLAGRVALSMSGGSPDGALVVWEDYRVNGLVAEIYAQKISLAGQVQWTANGVFVCGDADEAGGGNPRVGARLTSDFQGGSVIAWEDTREDGNLAHADLYVSRIQSNGSFAWGQSCGLLVAGGPGQQFAPLLRVDEGDQVIIFWDDTRTGSQSIRYQKLAVSNGSQEFGPEGELIVYGLDGDALKPKSLPMNDHRVGIVWQDNRAGSGGSRLYYQIVRADSQRIVERELNGDPITTSTTASQTNQERHDICTDGAAGFFVCFEDNRTGTKTIRLSHVNSAGEVICSPEANQVWPPPIGQDQGYSQVAYDQQGGCYVAWSGYSASFSLDVFVMRMTSACEPAWAAPVQVSTLPSDDPLFELVSNPDGCCIAVWQSGEFQTENISAARVCPDGSMTWSLDVCNAPNTQEDPTVLEDGLGGAYFSWGDYRNQDFSKDIYAQHLTAAGTATWAANGLAVLGGMANLQQKPVLAKDSQRNLIVIWEDYRSGEQLDLFGQKITPAGERLWQADGKPICNARLVQENTASYVEWADGIYVNWTDSRGAYSDLYGTHINSSGSVANSYWYPDSGNVVCDFYQRQDFPTVANDGWGGILSTWQDARASGKDPLVNIWCQWVNDWAVEVTPRNELPLPREYSLAQNFPNPFNPATTITFSIPVNERVELTVFNTMGQAVATLVDEHLASGTYDVYFNAPNLASGIYFYRLKTAAFQNVKKMTLLK